MTNVEIRAWIAVNDLSHAEAANILGLTVGALRSMMYRDSRYPMRSTIRIVELYNALKQNNLCPEAYLS